MFLFRNVKLYLTRLLAKKRLDMVEFPKSFAMLLLFSNEKMLNEFLKLFKFGGSYFLE
jgi:hypothetical protein